MDVKIKSKRPAISKHRDESNYKVAIVVDETIALFELGCAVELFSLPRPEIDEWYQSDVVSFTKGNLSATGGVSIKAKSVTDLSAYDMVVIPSWPIDKPVPEQIENEIVKLYQRGGKVISFCSGAFLVAEIGLLNNTDGITHWRYADAFKKRFPLVNYVDNVLYLYSDRIGCSAGSSAAIDLGIEVIRSDFGHQTANKVARRLVLASHRSGGQSQFVETPLPKKADGFSQTLDWAIQNLHTKIDVAYMAKMAKMTRRTFDRKFRKSLNMSAGEWIILQRLNRAKMLLETSGQTVDLVAYNSGFESAMSLRHNFRKYVQISPSQYRQEFGEGCR